VQLVARAAAAAAHLSSSSAPPPTIVVDDSYDDDDPDWIDKMVVEMEVEEAAKKAAEDDDNPGWRDKMVAELEAEEAAKKDAGMATTPILMRTSGDFDHPINYLPSMYVQCQFE
jgi:hypothetical protein